MFGSKVGAELGAAPVLETSSQAHLMSVEMQAALQILQLFQTFCFIICKFRTRCDATA